MPITQKRDVVSVTTYGTEVTIETLSDYIVLSIKEAKKFHKELKSAIKEAEENKNE